MELGITEKETTPWALPLEAERSLKQRGCERLRLAVPPARHSNFQTPTLHGVQKALMWPFRPSARGIIN